MDETTVTPEAENDQPTEAEAKAAWFKELKKNFGPSAPDESQVDAWKQSVGRVRVVAFGTDQVYFFRPLRAAEYRGMVQQVQSVDRLQQDDLLKEKIVAAAVLWPKIDPTEMGALYAGTKDSLHLMIMQASNFVTPDEAELMVREL